MFALSFILKILGILVLFHFPLCFVLFDVVVECFRFTQEDKVRIYQIETKFFKWKLKMYDIFKNESQIYCNTLSVNMRTRGSHSF